MARYLGNLEDPMAIALKDELKKGESIVLELVLSITQLGITVNSKQNLAQG